MSGFMLSVIVVSVIMLCVMMLSVIMLSTIMLSMIMMSVIMVNVIILSFMEPLNLHKAQNQGQKVRCSSRFKCYKNFFLRH